MASEAPPPPTPAPAGGDRDLAAAAATPAETARHGHHYAALARSGRPRPPAPRPDPEVPSAADLLERHTVSLTGPEVREATGVDLETFRALETYGLLRADPSGHYGEDALAVAAAARTLAAHGLEARHLRPFRTAADREIGLAEQVLATRHGQGTQQERTAEIVSACLALHVALVRSGLSR